MWLHTHAHTQKRSITTHLTYLCILRSILKCRAVSNIINFIWDIKFLWKLLIHSHFCLELSELFLQLLLCVNFLQTWDKSFEIQF